MSLNVYYFSLRMSYSECMQVYTGQIQHAVLTSEQGVRVQVPINRIKAHLDSFGVNGRFRLAVDQNNKIVAFERADR